MNWLDGGQRAIMQALDYGPAHLPAELFLGQRERVLAGMKVHANTISHARLVALEDTFPRTRDHIGHDRFNQHSRLFIQQSGVTAKAHAAIGEGFDRFLVEHGEATGVGSLARFEWLWLQAYHAAEAAPLELAALTSLAPEELLSQLLVRHPAARAAKFDPLVHALLGAEVSGLGQAEAILIARPDAEVLVSSASGLMIALLAAAENPVTIGNLLARMSETNTGGASEVDAFMQALIALINAGAIANG